MKIETSLFFTLIITFLGNVGARSTGASSAISPTFSRGIRARQTTLQSIRGGGARKNKKNDALVVEKKENPLEVFVNTVKESRRHLAAAAAARSVSIFSMFPVGMLFIYNLRFLFCYLKL